MHTVLLVTVTKVEAQAVLDLCSKASGLPWERHFIGDKTYYALGQIGGVNIVMVQSEMGTSGPGAALLTVHNAISALTPAAVIMVGVAFGFDPQKQHLGDVLVSRQLQAYEPQKIKEQRKLIPRGDRVTASSWLLDKFRGGDLDWPDGKVHFGLILSGEKLINDQRFRDKLLAFEPEAIGGEMEGAGLYAAAHNSKVDWILVKSICDWADEKKTDEYQQIAACNAASFTLHVIQQGGFSTTDSNVHTSKNLLQVQAKRRECLILAMMGAKGGVGKSTITCRMAEMIAETGHNVAILDLDTGTAGSTTLLRDRGFKITGSISVYEILASIAEKREIPVAVSSLTDVTPDYLSEREEFGKVFLMPAVPLNRERKVATIQLFQQIDSNLNSDTMRMVLDRLLDTMKLNNNMIDCIIIDCGAEGVEFNHLIAEAYFRSTVTYIVAQPEPVCRENIRHVTQLLRQNTNSGYGKLRVIINCIVSQQHEPVARAQFSDYEVAGCIPFDLFMFGELQKGRVNHRYGYDIISHAVRDVLGHDLPTNWIPDESDLWVRPATRALIELDLIRYFRTAILRRLILQWLFGILGGLALIAYGGWLALTVVSVSGNAPLLFKFINAGLVVLGGALLVGTVSQLLFWSKRILFVRKLRAIITSSQNKQIDIEKYLLSLNAVGSNFERLEWLRGLVAMRRRALQGQEASRGKGNPKNEP